MTVQLESRISNTPHVYDRPAGSAPCHPPAASPAPVGPCLPGEAAGGWADGAGASARCPPSRSAVSGMQSAGACRLCV